LNFLSSILHSARSYFESPLAASDIVATFAGLRPLFSQDIARPQRATQLRRTARGKRFIARDRSVQITRDGQTDSFKHEALSVTSA